MGGLLHAMQVQQQFLTTMMMIIRSGNNVFSNAAIACTFPPSIPLIQRGDGRDEQNGEPNNGEGKEEE